MNIKLLFCSSFMSFSCSIFSSDVEEAKNIEKGDTVVIRVVEQPQGFSLAAAISQYVVQIDRGKVTYVTDVDQLVEMISTTFHHPWTARCSFVNKTVSRKELEEAIAQITERSNGFK